MQFHKGLDIAVPFGSDVVATAAGTAHFLGQKGGYGNASLYLTETDWLHFMDTFRNWLQKPMKK
ncbi:M23 family metallopeptidase [Chryseobacterium indoltheticum]|uniref:M23 family metallopeptidase n=1 Tax=Chryseobacterium indoltheticum TaxID=254 RepID=UPI003F49812F